MGELHARFYQNVLVPDVRLEVIRCDGWKREWYFEQTGLPWVLPSPNMPTNDTAVVYPGMCLIEGTNLSEGRGTTRRTSRSDGMHVGSIRTNGFCGLNGGKDYAAGAPKKGVRVPPGVGSSRT